MATRSPAAAEATSERDKLDRARADGAAAERSRIASLLRDAMMAYSKSIGTQKGPDRTHEWPVLQAALRVWEEVCGGDEASDDPPVITAEEVLRVARKVAECSDPADLAQHINTLCFAFDAYDSEHPDPQRATHEPMRLPSLDSLIRGEK